MGIPALTAPDPIELPPAGRLRSLRRIARGAMLGARYGAPAIARRRSGAQAARHVLERMGATYVKFGQFAASAPGIVGEAVAEEFRSCLDSGPPVPFADVRRVIERELGRPLADVFSRFEETPFAAGSIAVVHRAELRDGADVAVKVLRPGIEQTVATDLRLMEGAARFLAARGADQAYNMVGLMVSLRDQIAEELDLRNEARTMDVFRALYEQLGLTLIVVPRVHADATTRHVLTMEYLDGVPIDDLSQAATTGTEPAALVRELLRGWVLSGLRAGGYHADIHAGNLLLLRDGRLGMIDWGIIARLDAGTGRLFREICRASLGEASAWDAIGQIMIDVNGPSFYALGLTDDNVRRFARESLEPVLTRPLSEVSMSDLFVTGDDVIRKATGEAPPRRSLRDRWRMMRAAGRAYQTAARNGAFESPTMRMSFLSSKQLVYLERYARMYIPGETLLGDPEFIRRALAESPEPAAV